MYPHQAHARTDIVSTLRFPNGASADQVTVQGQYPVQSSMGNCLWCLYMDYQTLGARPIYFGPSETVYGLLRLLRDRVLPWHAQALVFPEIPRRRGRPAASRLYAAAVVNLQEAEWLIAEVNARFPLLALHVQGVWIEQLAEVLDVPSVGRKTVIEKYAGMLGQKIPARLSRGMRPISVIR